MEPSTVDVMSKFIINNRTDALKLTSFCFVILNFYWKSEVL